MKLQIFATAVLVVSCFAAALAMSPGSIEKVDLPGIKNFSHLTGNTGFAGDHVGFGGATEVDALPELASRGFAAVINLRLATEEGVDIEASRKAAEKAGMHFIHLPFDTDEPEPELVEDFLAAAGKPDNQPLYIHCNSAGRVAAMWMIGRVLRDGWTIDQASEEARSIAAKPEESIAFATSYLGSHKP